MASLFLFAVGWERPSTVLLLLGTVATIANIFAFAVGWDMLKSYRNSGRISGTLVFPQPGFRLTVHPTVTLSSIDGFNRTTISNRPDGGFDLIGIAPGEYLLSVEGCGLVAVAKSATILPGQRTDLGEVGLEFDPQQFWRKENLPLARLGHRIQIRRVGPGPEGSAWVVGFRTDRRMSNDYKVFRRQPSLPEWREVVIPHFSKKATQAIIPILLISGTM